MCSLAGSVNWLWHSRRSCFNYFWMTIAVSMLVACGGNSSEADSTLQQATPVTLKEATFAGRTSNSNLFGAVLTHTTGIEAYFCDGQRDYWFRGVPGDSIVEMVTTTGRLKVLSLPSAIFSTSTLDT